MINFYNICLNKMSRGRRQGELSFRTWGGRRSGAGRKPAGTTAGVSHSRRPVHHPRHPVHVTLRAVPGLPSLRGARVFPVVRCALGAASSAAFRVAHFSVQTNHVHLLVEADDTRALSRGIQGLAIRLAKAINRRLARAGRVWADRYHGHVLRTPREVRNGLVYVLSNGRKHGVSGRGVDPCSSGAWFRGWKESIPEPRTTSPVVPPRTWLLRVGWRRSSPIGLEDAPVRTMPRRPPCSFAS